MTFKNLKIADIMYGYKVFGLHCIRYLFFYKWLQPFNNTGYLHFLLKKGDNTNTPSEKMIHTMKTNTLNTNKHRTKRVYTCSFPLPFLTFPEVFPSITHWIMINYQHVSTVMSVLYKFLFDVLGLLRLLFRRRCRSVC